MKREGRAKKKTGLRDSSKRDLGESDEGSVCAREREGGGGLMRERAQLKLEDEQLYFSSKG